LERVVIVFLTFDLMQNQVKFLEAASADDARIQSELFSKRIMRLKKYFHPGWNSIPKRFTFILATLLILPTFLAMIGSHAAAQDSNSDACAGASKAYTYTEFLVLFLIACLGIYCVRKLYSAHENFFIKEEFKHWLYLAGTFLLVMVGVIISPAFEYAFGNFFMNIITPTWELWASIFNVIWKIRSGKGEGFHIIKTQEKATSVGSTAKDAASHAESQKNSSFHIDSPTNASQGGSKVSSLQVEGKVLEAIIEDEEAYKALEEFLTRDFCVENALFLKALSKFGKKKYDSREKQFSSAKKIYEDFCVDNAILCINIPFYMRKNLDFAFTSADALEKFDPTIFDASKMEISQLILQGHLKRFQKSEGYSKVSAQLMSKI